MVTFGKTKSEAPKPSEGPPQVDTANVLQSRLRIAEQRYSELRKKVLLIEQNMLSNHRKAMNEIKSLRSDVTSIRHSIQSVEDKIITIIKELKLTARKEDIQVMKRYIELWNPVTFVTRDAVDRIIDEKLGKKPESQKNPNV